MKFLSIFIFLILFSFSVSSSGINNKIILKVENNIVTNYEFKNKVLRILLLSDTEINQKNINQIKKPALNSLLINELKKIELEKYPIKISSSRLNKFILNISSTSVEELKKKFKENNIDYDLYVDEIETDLKWQSLIFNKFSDKINIDEDMINSEVSRILNNQAIIEEFNLSEIEIPLEISDRKSIDEKSFEIKEKIESQGFENVALSHSISLSSNNKGNLGWITLRYYC